MAERLRELAHDMDEGLLGFDAITPLKPHLGDGYTHVVRRLRGAVRSRYNLTRWDQASHAAHKHADRLAATSEAHHVVGWSAADILCRIIEEAHDDLTTILIDPKFCPSCLVCS